MDNKETLSQDEKALIIDYAKKILNLEKEVKDIREDIKIVKKEAKDNGVPIAPLNKAVKKIKESEKEKADLTKSEVDFLRELLEEDPEIKNLIQVLVTK